MHASCTEPSKHGDRACAACLCSVHTATANAFSATQGRPGTNTELTNCQDTVYQTLEQLDTAGGYWKDVITYKGIECMDFLFRTTGGAFDKDGHGLSKLCKSRMRSHLGRRGCLPNLGASEIVITSVRAPASSRGRRA